MVAVLVPCPLRSVAWHATYLDPTSHVCMFSFFFFFFFFFVLCFTSVVFLLLLVCPFIPCCSFVAVLALRCSRHARAGIPFFPYVSGGEHRHSFGATSCWFSLPVRFSLRFSWRRTLALLDTLLPCFALVTALCMQRMAYNILAFRRPVALLLLVCIFHARHATYLGTCAASFSFCCDTLRVLRRRRIPYMSGLALLCRVLVVYLHRGAVRYLFILLVYPLPRCACFVGF